MASQPDGEGLRDAGFAVDVAYDGETALHSARDVDYDVIALDRDLPNMHGDRVCRELVGCNSPARILMLTAAADVEDRVDGLEPGADDYLGKPVVFCELIARIRALGRRAPGQPVMVRRGDLVIDRARHRASRAGIPLTLTRKEFGVLEGLAGADGAMVTEELLEHGGTRTSTRSATPSRPPSDGCAASSGTALDRDQVAALSAA